MWQICLYKFIDGMLYSEAEEDNENYSEAEAEAEETKPSQLVIVSSERYSEDSE